MPGKIKTDLKEHTLKRSAQLAKALGHPARIAILKLLAERETCVCGDITDELPLAQSTISQHLKALKKAGIIQGEVDGVRTCYCLDEEGLREIQGLLIPLLTNLSTGTQKDECC